MIELEVNPLNVLNLRQVQHLPPHFIQVFLELNVPQKEIEDWIYSRLRGRYYFGPKAVSSAAQPLKARSTFCAAFEDHSEATYFGLILSTINTKNTFL